ncbi:hypothetical protein MCERH10_01271 [Caulobacteraceae bacterium]
MIQLQILNTDQTFFEDIERLSGTFPFIEVKTGRSHSFGMSGAEATSFVMISITSGVLGNLAYDTGKAFAIAVASRVKEAWLNRQQAISVKINGIVHEIDSLEAANELEQAISEEIGDLDSE